MPQFIFLMYKRAFCAASWVQLLSNYRNCFLTSPLALTFDCQLTKDFVDYLSADISGYQEHFDFRMMFGFVGT